uniref:Deoxyribonuclease 1 like 2 n=1 Tax=Malurus cyaneus samueli TaxID=2593467 RepID=A0A8C5U541_9PASS
MSLQRTGWQEAPHVTLCPRGHLRERSGVLHLMSPHSQGTMTHRDCRAGPAGANPGATQLLDMPRPVLDGPSHFTVLTLCLPSASKSPYDYEISGPLGRDNYKEMYLFIYRTDVVSVVDTYQYEDPQDVFSRAPFILRVSAPSTKVKEFVLVPLHSAPHDAVAEIDALYDVYLAIIKKWGTDNMMFLGDFNADCSYVQPGDWSSIRLRTSDIFKWLLPDSADTTVGKSDCAYDRIVVCGNKLKRSIVSNSAGIYNFQRTFQLDQEEVSQDHTFGALTGTKAGLAQAQGCPYLFKELRVTQDPRVYIGQGIWGHCLSPQGRDAQGFFWSSMGRTQGMGHPKPIFNYPSLAQSPQMRHGGLRGLVVPCQCLPQATPGHLSMRCQNWSFMCQESWGWGQPVSPRQQSEGSGRATDHPAGPTSTGRGEGLTEHLPPLALLQALAVSDHYPVEVKLTA